MKTITIASPVRVLDSNPLVILEDMHEWSAEYTADICRALVHAYILTTPPKKLYYESNGFVSFGRDWDLNFVTNNLNETGGALVEIYYNPKDPEYVGTVVVDYDE